MDVSSLIPVLWPELVLTVAACVLFLLGVSPSSVARRLAPIIALAVLAGIFFCLAIEPQLVTRSYAASDSQNVLGVGEFAVYIKMIAAGMGVLFVLLSWPTNTDATGNSALDFGLEGGEFFGLMLLSLAGVFLVAGANDIMLLFLGIELASIPTYVMVSISRPLPIAQEAGVKYFFLGAMSAALMLFGFSYLYGTTGITQLDKMTVMFQATMSGGKALPTWQLFSVVILLAGFAFKIAAVPLHAYAGDVYQGAATPVTALLAFVPKTAGFVAIIKILGVVGGTAWVAPDVIFKLLWVVAVLTMSFGNALGLLQFNIKRVFAYSSVAHSGYMLVGLAALMAAGAGDGVSGAEAIQHQALTGVLFYLAAYGIMNTGAFGILMLLPGRTDAHGRHGPNGEPLPTAGSAETFEDLAGAGRRNPKLGIAMMVCCLSLTGLPLTIGFFGKVLLIKPALAIVFAHHPQYSGWMGWLVVITMINAAVSAAYYLRIVATMFLRTESTDEAFTTRPSEARGTFLGSGPIALAVVLSVAGTLLFGIYLPSTDLLSRRAERAAQLPLHPDLLPVATADAR